MGKLLRYITSDGTVSIIGVDTTDMVARAEQIHRTSAVTTAALGRLLTASSMIGITLKGEKDSVTLRMNGNGPAGTLIAVSDSFGNARGYVSNPIVEIPLNNKGKLDVSGAIGKDGSLIVMKDIGMKEPYIGNVPIVSGEIAEDITYYYAVSEQIPTVCALGVLVNPNLTVNAAGGFIIQLLPFAPDDVVDKLEKSINKLKPVTTMLSEGMSIADICALAMDGFELELLDEFDVEYRCDCNRERVEKALCTVGKQELTQILEQDGKAELNCHFCDKKYRFDSADLEKMIKEL